MSDDQDYSFSSKVLDHLRSMGVPAYHCEFQTEYSQWVYPNINYLNDTWMDSFERKTVGDRSKHFKINPSLSEPFIDLHYPEGPSITDPKQFAEEILRLNAHILTGAL